MLFSHVVVHAHVGVFQYGKVNIIPNDLGIRKPHSCVAFTEDECLVGDAAEYQGAINPANTIFAIKRLVGRRSNDPCVISDKKHWSYEVVDDNGRPKVKVEYRGEIKT